MIARAFVIKSTSNERIKYLKSLNQKKYREENSQFIVENFKTIYDSRNLETGLDELFVTEEFIEKNKEKFEELIDDLDIQEYFLINQAVNETLSSLDNPSGICALYDMKQNQMDFDDIIIYLNKINDPGNMGTILRSALAFDIKNIVLDENCVDIYNPKTINSAKDSIFKLNISRDNDRKLLKEIKSRMKIYSTRLEDSSGIEILKKQKKFCIVFGSEANGIDGDIYELSDGFIKINMTNNIESINVAMSASIIFHYIYNNLR
ncbi:MAG: RNA methyltransferase [Patescibacteria group bacterium]|nr:RNA methyltransferase [Patescibacteria group bacterium]